MALQQTRGIHTHVDNRRQMTAEVSNASSTHALAQMHEQIQPNAREHRPVPHALTQGPQKTPLGTKQH